MPSLIDASVPVAGVPTTASVRGNFATAAAEITALQLGLLPLAATRAALRACAPAAGASVLELGYTTPGDKEPRLWCWDPGSTAADDNGSVICPDGHPIGTPGRWTLGPDNGGCVDLVDFGPVGQGADDTAAMRAAIATGCNVRLPAAVLNFNTATGPDVFLLSNNDQTIRGAAIAGRLQTPSAGTIIKSTASGAILFHFQGANAACIHDILFDCPSMTDGWCVFFDNCGPCSGAENLNFLAAPGLVAKGNAGSQTFTRELRAAGGVNGGSVALVDGSTSTLRAAVYGFGTAVQVGNSGPWLVEDIVIGAGGAAFPSIGFYVNGACDSVGARTVRVNNFDIGVCLADSFGVPTGAGTHPAFFTGFDIGVQTPGCTLFPNSAGFQINSGSATNLTGQIFCNQSAGYGLVASQPVADLKVDGIRFNGCAKDCVLLQCSGGVISNGTIKNAGYGMGNSGSANIHIGGNAQNIVIAHITGMGIAAGDTGFDLNISPAAQNIMLIGNNWTGGKQPTLINDTALIGIHIPSIRQSWTPTLAFATPGTSSWNYASGEQTGFLWRDGNWIIFEARLTATINAYTGAAGNLTIRGLPATAGPVGLGQLPATIGQWSNITLDTSFTQLTGEIIAATTTIGLYEQKSAGGSQSLTPANVPPSTANVSIHITGRYQMS